MYADAEAAGALCGRCTLRGLHTPVPSINRGHRTAVIASFPSKMDTESGLPLVGPGGMLLDRTLRSLRHSRRNVDILTAVACLPPKSDLYKAVKAAKRANAVAKIGVRDCTLDNPDYTPSPLECCRPRLLRELQTVDNVVALGKAAVHAVIPRMSSGILAVRGTMAEVDHPSRPGKLKVLPTVRPAYVLRQNKWSSVFTVDIARAFRWFSGELSWIEPREIVYHPTADQLEAFLFDPAIRFHAYDVETDGIQSLTTGLRCVGFATTDRAMLVGLLSIDRQSHFYSPAEDLRVRDVMRRWFVSRRKKVGYNAGTFDRIVIEQHFNVTPAALLDSLICHKAVAAEMPHNLGFVGSIYTDVHAWKADKTATEAATDETLHRYCVLDCIVNARIMAPMVAQIVATGQGGGAVGGSDAELLANRNRSAVDRDHAMQVAAVGMKRQGMLIDQTRRAEWDIRIRRELERWHSRVLELLPGRVTTTEAYADIHERERDRNDAEGYTTQSEANALGIDIRKFNPGSTQQVGRVLFDVWDLPEANDLKPKDLYTGSGARSTGSAVLQAYQTDRRIPQTQRDLCHAILMWRKQKKLLGTYIIPMRYAPGEDNCRVLSSGRVHSSWNILPIVGRFNSSGPNVQNWPSKFDNANMKELVIPQPGCVFVGADVDQFHLRLIANMWGVQSLLDCFRDNLDPHAVAAETFMGGVFCVAEGYAGPGIKPAKGTLAHQLREVAKRLRYAGAYGATAETIFRVLRSATDENGRLINPSLTLAQVYLMVERRDAAEPEWKAAWAAALDRWKSRGGIDGGYLESPILKRRRDCLDGNPNDIYNYEILSGEGDIMGDMTCAFIEAVPFGYAGPGTGLINQCHDSMTAEVPEADAERVAAIMLACMNRTYPGWTVPITSEVEIGKRWSKV